MMTGPPADAPVMSRGLRRISAWVGRFGALRSTLAATLVACAASVGLTWGWLTLSGHPTMGNALWISMLVPVPLSLAFGGVSFYLLVALERARSRVQELAMADPLTGLGNRRRFVAAAKRELDLAARYRQPLAIMLLDVDHFKLINDSHGHHVGDLVLVEVGRRCQQTVRTSDLLARWGGEEFIVLLPNTPVEQAQQLAERMRQAVSATAQAQVRERAVLVTVSVGVAGTSVGQPARLDDLIRLADLELYKAKHAGRDRVSRAGRVAAAFAGPLVHNSQPARL